MVGIVEKLTVLVNHGNGCLTRLYHCKRFYYIMSLETWQLCLNWLRLVGVVEEDQAFKTAADLALLLKDGYVLCQLAIYLAPASVRKDKVFLKPRSQFHSFENINTFLQACSKSFGLRSDVLFSAEDLFHAYDFAKVVNTIYLVSCSRQALSKGLSPFLSNAPASEEEEDIYGNIQDVIDDFDDGEDDYIAQWAHVRNVKEELCREDSIYNDAYLSDDKWEEQKEDIGDPQKLLMAQTELVDTELNYVQDLWVIIGSYLDPLRESALVSEADIDVVFSNVTELYEIQYNFHAALEAEFNTETRDLGRVFVEMKDGFLKYAHYISRLDAAAKMVSSFYDQSEIEAFLYDAQRGSGQRFGLSDMLSVPMQRILKYPLLLKVMVKASPKNSEIFQHLQEALVTMQEVSTFINETKREYEHAQTVIELQERLSDYTGPDISTFGRLIKDGAMKMKMSSEIVQKDRHIFLFESGILICKRKGTDYHFKGTVTLLGTVASEQLMQQNPFVEIRSKDSLSNCNWYIKSKIQRAKWIEALTDAIYAMGEMCNMNQRSPSLISFLSIHNEGVKRHKKSKTETITGRFTGRLSQMRASLFFGSMDIEDSAASVSQTSTKRNSVISRSSSATSLANSNSLTVDSVLENRDGYNCNSSDEWDDTPEVVPQYEEGIGNLKAALLGCSGVQQFVVALYDYAAQRSDELSFREGDRILLLDETDANWWKGDLNHVTGVFPFNYVEKESIPSSVQSTSASLKRSSYISKSSTEFEVPTLSLKTATSTNHTDDKLKSKPVVASKPATLCKARNSAKNLSANPMPGNAKSPIPLKLPPKPVVSSKPPLQVSGSPLRKSSASRRSMSIDVRNDNSLSKSGSSSSIRDEILNRRSVSAHPLPVSLISPKCSDTSKKVDLESQPWYHGKLANYKSIETLLNAQKKDSFLVRESESRPGNYSISLRVGGLRGSIKHLKIHKNSKGYSFSEGFEEPSIVSLIERYHNVSLAKHFAQVDMCLDSPCVKSTPTASPTNKDICTALYTYESTDPKQLSFVAGDKLTILERFPDGWYSCMFRGKTGIAPGNFFRDG